MATANWSTLKFEVPGQAILSEVRGAMEALLVFLEVLKTILETIKIFLVDFGNPIKALVEALIKVIVTLFESLKKSGFYGYFDIPDPIHDPNLFRQVGGYQAFLSRFKGSVVDTRDPNRPQPTPGFDQSGFILFVVDADNIQTLLKLIKSLLKFFGKDLLSPQYSAPANVRALPVGDNGDPILAVAKVFSSQPKAVAVEWSLPTNQQPPDPGFSDLATTVGIDFIPPKFLVERSTLPLNAQIDASTINNSDSVGVVTFQQVTPFETRGQPGQTITRVVNVVDEYGDPFVKFQKYVVIDTSSNTATFLLGALGKFRYIDTDVDFDHTYYYRVRAYSGDLTINGTSLAFTIPSQPEVLGKNTGIPVVVWPGTPIMGRASGVVRARLAKMPVKFDVVNTLQRLFQTAFSLNFHLSAPTSKTTFDEDGDPIPGVTFDANGNPTPASRVDAIGQGLLARQASLLGGITFLPLTGKYASPLGISLGLDKSPGTFTGTGPLGQAILQPWQQSNVRRTASRLANDVASSLLENGTGTIESYRSLMQSALPRGNVGAAGFDGATTLEKLVVLLTDTGFEGVVAADGATRYGAAYADATFRKNIIVAIQFVTSFTLGGVPPDWVRLSLLRDVIPWSAQILYDLIAKVQALVDAYKGVMDEIKQFIDLLVRKIDVLERFIKYLISILDVLLSLSVGAFVLFLPATSDGTPGWFQAIDSAGGVKPTSGPAGYSCGVGIAYVAPDISGFTAPLKLIFGG